MITSCGSSAAFLSCLFCILSCALANAQEQQRPFVWLQGVAKDVERYEAYIKENWKAEREEGTRTCGSPPTSRCRPIPAAPRAAMPPPSPPTARAPENWLGLARSLLAIKADPDKGSERYDLPVNASGAAYRAYELSTDPALKARALAVLGDAMQRRSYVAPGHRHRSRPR